MNLKRTPAPLSGFRTKEAFRGPRPRGRKACPYDRMICAWLLRFYDDSLQDSGAYDYDYDHDHDCGLTTIMVINVSTAMLMRMMSIVIAIVILIGLCFSL